jgi:hypothetical protein
MANGTVIFVNGSEVTAYVIELIGGLRIRLAIDDCERLDLYRGQRISVRLPQQDESWLYVAEAVENPPVAWLLLVQRFRDQARGRVA